MTLSIKKRTLTLVNITAALAAFVFLGMLAVDTHTPDFLRLAFVAGGSAALGGAAFAVISDNIWDWQEGRKNIPVLLQDLFLSLVFASLPWAAWLLGFPELLGAQGYIIPIIVLTSIGAACTLLAFAAVKTARRKP